MNTENHIHYELEHFYPDVDQEKFWELFVDHEAWTHSEFLPNVIILKPGQDHPQGAGAIRSVNTGSMKIKEDIVGFQAPTYFRYATHNGSLPVLDFGGEFFLEGQANGLRVQYKASFKPKYIGTGWLFRFIFQRAQMSAFKGLGKAYNAHYGL